MGLVSDFLYWLQRKLSPINASLGLLWYEDNNLGVNGGVPLDMWSKFDDPAWQSVPIDVYLMHMVVLSNTPETWLTGVLTPFLMRNHIALAMDAEGATWTTWGGREAIFAREMKLLERLALLGIPVRYISLQSVLSKRPPDKSDYPLAQRIEDIRRYIDAAAQYHPEACFGLIDAAPTQGQPWRKMYTAMLDAESRLSYLHLDAPYNHIRGWFDLSWREIRQVQEFVRGKLDFGLLLTSQEQSNAAYIQAITQMQAEASRHLEYHDQIITSWFQYPDVTVPLLTDWIHEYRFSSALKR